MNLKEEKFKKKFVENVVIGSGPSGSITALKLKEKNKDTLIIEKGNFYKNFKYKHPGKEFLTKWEFGGLSSSMGNSEIKYASAECFGGGSEINSGLYHEPDKNFVKNLIKNYNIKNLKYKDLIKNLRNIKKLVRINSMKLEKNLVSNLIYKTAKKIGWRVETIPRLINNNFKKSSMTSTFLKGYIKRKGKVLLNANVTKIRKNNRLWEIKILKNNKIINLNCKNLFICAGTINTLALLKKNNLIQKKKISKFHFHPMIKVIAKFPYKINDKNFDISSTQINNFFPQFIIGNASSTKAQLKINSYQNKKVYGDIERNWHKMGIFHVTFSLGEGKIYTKLNQKDPIVFYNIKKKEIKILNKGLNSLINFLIKAGSEYVYPITSLNKIITSKNLEILNLKSPKKFNLSTVHLLGGCPFGENKANTILDSYGKVHTQNNLFVNDGSLICGNLVKNPQGIIMSLAYRNIEHFIKKF